MGFVNRTVPQLNSFLLLREYDVASFFWYFGCQRLFDHKAILSVCQWAVYKSQESTNLRLCVVLTSTRVGKLQVLETLPLRNLMSCFCDMQGGGPNFLLHISSFRIGKKYNYRSNWMTSKLSHWNKLTLSQMVGHKFVFLIRWRTF